MPGTGPAGNWLRPQSGCGTDRRAETRSRKPSRRRNSSLSQRRCKRRSTTSARRPRPGTPTGLAIRGTARNVDFAGFHAAWRRCAVGSVPHTGVIAVGLPPRGVAVSATIHSPGGAPLEPGEYDLILSVAGQGIIARQPIEVRRRIETALMRSGRSSPTPASSSPGEGQVKSRERHRDRETRCRTR